MNKKRTHVTNRKRQELPEKSTVDKLKEKLVPLSILSVLIGGLVVIIVNNSGGGNAHIVDVSVPQLSPAARVGESIFSKVCATCHGKNAGGSENGPPLIHKIYNPGHHADQSFIMAAQRGVRSHHWQFGNMPPVEGLSKPDILSIIRYVRELQRANGIVYEPHKM